MNVKKTKKTLKKQILTDKICIIGLGYVGLPLAVAFAKHFEVIGFDIKARRVAELRKGIDRTKEVEPAKLKLKTLSFTSDPKAIATCNFIIVAVPTPVTKSNAPDLRPLLSASEIVGLNMSKGCYVVYESTVYPGATEEDCVPVLEKFSGFSCGKDFKVGYSPERINPGDTIHTFENIIKVVSGQDEEAAEKVAQVYGTVVKAGVHKASSIRVAEAAKVIENTQRDLNIALMNELALIFEKMGIRTADVLTAAATKWNFLPFRPGMVGGHCIGVDPYYLTHRAVLSGYHPEMILAGRRINDDMAREIGRKTVRLLAEGGVNLSQARILILGFTFKENIPDVRNSKVIDLRAELLSWGAKVDVYDPIADIEDTLHEYRFTLVSKAAAKSYDAVVFAVAHREFVEQGLKNILNYLDPQVKRPVLIDVKSCFSPEEIPKHVLYWSL